MLRRVLLLAALPTALAGPAAAGSPPLSLSASEAFSPNRDGVRDRASIVVTLASPSTVTLTVHGAEGEVVATLLSGVSLAAGATEVPWDGRADDGETLRDGSYRLAAAAAVGDGLAEAETTVRIDTRPPTVAWRAVPWLVRAAVLPTRFRVADAALVASVSLHVRGRDGSRWRSRQRVFPIGEQSTSWALRRSTVGRLRPGGFRLWLEAVDDAGNRGSSAVRPLLLEYPVTTVLVRRVDGAGPRVALTFDDCNDGWAWSSILSTLAARNVKATFFCLGSQVSRHGPQARRTLRDGHAIGNHSWNHAFLPRLSATRVSADARRTTMAWWKLAKQAPFPYYRPPYGALDREAARGIGAAGYGRIVLWDVDPQDWRRPGAATIAARVVGAARSGSIVLLHVLPQTADALPAIVSGLRAKELEPVSLDRLFAARSSR